LEKKDLMVKSGLEISLVGRIHKLFGNNKILEVEEENLVLYQDWVQKFGLAQILDGKQKKL